MWVVDQTFPANDSTRLLKVDPHYHEEIIGQLVAQRLEAGGVVERRAGIVHRTGTDDNQQSVVLLVEDIVNGLACVMHRLGGHVGDG